MLEPTATIQQDKKSQLTPDLLRFFIVGLLFFGLALLLRHEMSGKTYFQIQEIRVRLLGENLPGGQWSSSAIFLLSSGLLISLGVPRLWVCGIAGAVYGVGLGALLAMGGSMIGATSVYLLGRSLLAEMVQRRFVGRLALWGQLLRQNGFWWVLYGRLFPFSNATINSLICGCCRVPLGQYLTGSFLGFIPLTLVFTAFGSGGAHGNLVQVLIGLGLLGLALLCRLLVKRFSPQS
jgi:uncharacterized membrane protein YdjX (TVP38/TMEM64 family)